MKTYIKVLMVIIAIYLLSACKKDKILQAPSINFKTGVLYTQNGDTVAVGHALYFGIQARGNNADITNFTVKKHLPNGTVITVMDTALYSKYIDIDKLFYQNIEPLALWVFTVMDRNRMTSEVSLNVYKDPNSQFGGILYIPSVKLGFQNNSTFGHFLNPSMGKVYGADSAGINQSAIDILCYFKTDDTPPSAVLSSPGEMDNFSTDAQTFYPPIVNWSTRNYTLWDISLDNGNNAPLTSADFDAAQNDSLLIVSYHEIWGKKKFKYATQGKIIPFLTQGGKLGLIKVIEVEEMPTGFIEISLKIQQ